MVASIYNHFSGPLPFPTQRKDTGEQVLIGNGNTGERPYVGRGEVGDGYGMPSSHTQAAAFLVAWGIGYAMTLDRRKQQSAQTRSSARRKVSASRTRYISRVEHIQSWRTGVYLLGLVLWSSLVAYSR